MTNMKRHSVICLPRYPSESVGDVRAPLLRVVPLKSRYGDTTCVTYGQPHFLPLNRSKVQTIEINIRSNTGELVSFEIGKSIVRMYQLPAFKGAARQRGYSIGGIFKGLTRTFVPVVKKGLLNFGKQALQSRVQVLDDISRREDVIKRSIERAKKMGKKSTSRAPTRKTASR